MDLETFYALRPHDLWDWFLRIAFLMGIWLFAVRDARERAEWIGYALAYAVMAIGTFFFGWIGFVLALVLVSIIGVQLKNSWWKIPRFLKERRERKEHREWLARIAAFNKKRRAEGRIR